MKAIDGGARYALLLVPLLLGSAVIWFTISSATASTSGTELEGALLGMALLGWGVTFVLPPMVVAIGVWALRGRRVPFPLFFIAVLIALGPVAYFQCANMQSSLPLAYLSGGMNFPQYTQAYPRLLTEALAIFCSVVAILSYGLYRVVRAPSQAS